MTKPRQRAIVFLLLGLAGLSVATFMSVKKLTNAPIPCSILEGCEVVTTSDYGTVAGIPVAVYGVFYYLTIVILSIIVLDSGSARWLKRLAMLTAVGFVVSIYLFSVQAFILGAFCFYCLLSGITSTLLFLTGAITLRQAFLKNASLLST